MYFLYNLLLWAASPLLLLWLCCRALKGRLAGLAERLGALPPIGDLHQPAIWLHAVSLGEVKLALALASELRSRVPALRCVFTSSTQTGHDEIRRSLAASDHVFYPPLDYGWICRRFLRRIRPQLLIVLETEIWPNLFREAKRRGAGLFVVNGRISDRSFPAYRRTRFFWRRVLPLIDGLHPQSARDAARFAELGFPAARMGAPINLKYTLRPAASRFVEVLRGKLQTAGAGPILVAGSTMSGEDELLIDAYIQLQKEFPGLWMILAPRHPQRCPAILEQIAKRGVAPQLRSEWREETAPRVPGVLLLDSTGELADLYRIATVAFVGGTLAPTGGHNILEPAYFARPIVIGPSMENFAELAAQFLKPSLQAKAPGSDRIRTGSLVQVQDAESLLVALRYLFSHPEFANSLGQSAHACLKQFGGLDPLLGELEAALARQPALRSRADAAAAPATETVN